MSKVATVLLVDQQIQELSDFASACDICEQIVVDKILYTASDEVALVVAGTTASRSNLYETSRHSRCHHISVQCELTRASKQTLAAISALRRTRAPNAGVFADQQCAFAYGDALRVAIDVLETKTAGKKYSRAIYLIADSSNAVLRKTEAASLMKALQQSDITLVVVAFAFGRPIRGLRCHSSSYADPTHLMEGSHFSQQTKDEVETVLRVICEALGGESCVVSPADALASLSLPRRRRVRQQAALKTVLRIGDIGIAAQLFVHAQQEKVPTLQRCTGDGAAVTQRVAYEAVGASVEAPETREVPAQDLVKVFFFGADRIPCGTADTDAMQVTGLRALEAIGFVKLAEVDPAVLMGGTRVLMPLAGDHAGQRGYNALVKAMKQGGMAMLVRLVRCRDGPPSLCVCFPQKCETTELPRCLVVAPLPFADDVRGYHFSEYPEFQFTAAEEQLMDDVMDGLTVGQDVLASQEVYNPVLQQFYATVKAKLLSPDSQAAGPDDVSQVPPLVEHLTGTSTNFFAGKGVVHELVEAHRAQLEKCAAAFPYEEAEDSADRTMQGGGTSWLYRHAARAAENARTQQQQQQRDTLVVDVDADTTSAPSTVAAQARKHASPRRSVNVDGEVEEIVDEDGETTTSCDRRTTATAPHILSVHRCHSSSPSRVWTADSVKTFHAEVKGNPDVSRLHVLKAKNDLCDTIETLLRTHNEKKEKSNDFAECVECVAALREQCVVDMDAQYYNNFLAKLQTVARRCGHYDDFWQAFVVARKDSDAVSRTVWPITAKECATSHVVDVAAAEAFVKADTSASALVFDVDAVNDDWQIEIE